MFNDIFVVASAPNPHDPLSPYEYMDESGISWVTGEISSRPPPPPSVVRSMDTAKISSIKGADSLNDKTSIQGACSVGYTVQICGRDLIVGVTT